MADLKQFSNHVERDKWVFEKHFYEGITYVALAKELGVSPTRVRFLALRGAQHLGLYYYESVEIKRTRKLVKRKP